MNIYVLIDKNGDEDEIEGVITDEELARQWRLGDMGFDYVRVEIDNPALLQRLRINDGPLRERNVHA